MERKDHAQLGIAEIARNRRVDVALRSKAKKFGSHAQKVVHREKRLRGQFGKGTFVEPFARREKGMVSSDITRLEARNFGLILSRFPPVVEGASIVEDNPIEWAEFEQIQVRVEFAPGEVPEF